MFVTKIFLVFVLILMIVPQVFSATETDRIKNAPCFTPGQQNCLFAKLLPFIVLVLAISLVGYFKFRKQIAKIPLNSKILYSIFGVLLFYTISAALTNLFFIGQCV
jgi:hypothetical protein